MIQLCCPKDVFKQYTDGSLSFEEAKRSLNKYTTTLHGEAAPPPRAHTQPITPSHALSPGINSAIIKLGKLTVANKCYRGSTLPADSPPAGTAHRGSVPPECMSGCATVAGKSLPKEFWQPNDFAVKGVRSAARPLAMRHCAHGPAPLFGRASSRRS